MMRLLPPYILRLKPDKPLAFSNQISRLFRDHDDRRVGVAADDRRHDGRIYHTQTGNAIDPQSRIDHRRCIDSHPAGRGWVPSGGCRAPHKIFQAGIITDIYTLRQLSASYIVKCLSLKNFKIPADACHQTAKIVRISEITRIYTRTV
jgi:hypothetical protein